MSWFSLVCASPLDDLVVGAVEHDAAGDSMTLPLVEYMASSLPDQLRLPLDTWVDLEACAASIDAAEVARRRGAIEASRQDATVASAIARRTLLPVEDMTCIDEIRRTIARWRLRALDCLTEVWLQRSNPGLAVNLATESLSIEPYRLHAGRPADHHVHGPRGPHRHVRPSGRPRRS